MNTNTNRETTAQTIQKHILSLLDELPPESLTIVEQFVQFLREQARKGKPVIAASEPERSVPYLYPTVPVPPSSLDGWLNLVPEGYEGDALVDTETLYHEVWCEMR